jgi:hypothetical protein
MESPRLRVNPSMVMNPETIVWGELYFSRTYENLTKDPRASICVRKRSSPFSPYKVDGSIKTHEHDKIAAQREERVRTAHGMEFKARCKELAAVYFTVEEIYDQTPDPESCRKTDLLRLAEPLFPFLQMIPVSSFSWWISRPFRDKVSPGLS